MYKPPNINFEFTKPNLFTAREITFLIGNFNSHSTSWENTDNNVDENAVEELAERNHLSLIHDAKLPASFNSGRWRRGYNPDNIFLSKKIETQCHKYMLTPIPRSQHRPIVCRTYAEIRPGTVIYALTTLEIDHVNNPKYLGVKLDYALTYKVHCEDTGRKVATKNNILQKLSGTKWGACPKVLRMSDLALCYSIGEYASSVWRLSAHAKKVDVALNNTNRIIIGCLKSIPVGKI
jgi:hypothetical protein